MNAQEFKDAYINLRSTCTRPPRRIFVRAAEAEEIKKDERIKEFVERDDKSGNYSIGGIPLEIVDFMVDPIYMFW